MNDSDDIRPSKTQLKKSMRTLRDLGLRLTEFAPETLTEAALPVAVVAAVSDYRKITSRGALKRQAQYIGRLMREAGEDEIEAIRRYVATADGENRAHNALMQRLERQRARLLAADAAATDYLRDHAEVDAPRLRTLIRNARREAEAQKPPKSARALFQLLKAHASEQD